jgi:hypothetical protein
MWNLVSDCLEMYYCQWKIGVQFVPNIPWLRNPFGRKIVAWFVPNIPYAQKSCWTHPMELLGDVGHVESRFDSFGDSVSISAR